MKTKITKPEKTFDAVKSIRKIKDEISADTAHMNFEQLQAYFEQERKKQGKA